MTVSCGRSFKEQVNIVKSFISDLFGRFWLKNVKLCYVTVPIKCLNTYIKCCWVTFCPWWKLFEINMGLEITKWVEIHWSTSHLWWSRHVTSVMVFKHTCHAWIWSYLLATDIRRNSEYFFFFHFPTLVFQPAEMPEVESPKTGIILDTKPK